MFMMMMMTQFLPPIK